jgi:hypothetical protein
MRFIVALLCAAGLLGSVGERIQARARCREIRVRQKEVVIKFTSEEDAKIFAEDFKQFIQE